MKPDGCAVFGLGISGEGHSGNASDNPIEYLRIWGKIAFKPWVIVTTLLMQLVRAINVHRVRSILMFVRMQRKRRRTIGSQGNAIAVTMPTAKVVTRVTS